MTELLPCPFCGSEAEIMSDNVNDYHIVFCKNETSCGATVDFVEGAENAYKKWNKRILTAHVKFIELTEKYLALNSIN